VTLTADSLGTGLPSTEVLVAAYDIQEAAYMHGRIGVLTQTNDEAYKAYFAGGEEWTWSGDPAEVKRFSEELGLTGRGNDNVGNVFRGIYLLTRLEAKQWLEEQLSSIDGFKWGRCKIWSSELAAVTEDGLDAVAFPTLRKFVGDLASKERAATGNQSSLTHDMTYCQDFREVWQGFVAGFADCVPEAFPIFKARWHRIWQAREDLLLQRREISPIKVQPEFSFIDDAEGSPVPTERIKPPLTPFLEMGHPFRWG